MAEHDGEGDFIELDAGPVGGTVDPEVLGEAAVGTLGAGEVDEGAKGRVGTVAGEEGESGAVPRSEKAFTVSSTALNGVVMLPAVMSFGISVTSPRSRRRGVSPTCLEICYVLYLAM